jgi:hypothetical protein
MDAEIKATRTPAIPTRHRVANATDSASDEWADAYSRALLAGWLPACFARFMVVLSMSQLMVVLFQKSSLNL